MPQSAEPHVAQYEPEKEIEQEVEAIFTLQKNIEATEQELMQNERFRAFLQMQKEFKEKSELYWAAVESQMIKHNIKSLKGSWGSLTIAERLSFDIDMEQLPAKFVKKVADTKKIATSYQLEGKAPKGTAPKWTQYLVKRLK